MPSQVNMKKDSDLYRAVLAYDHQPVSFEIYPAQPGRRGRLVPSGPVEVKEEVIGPYTSTAPIKSYVTRQRGSYMNLRILRVEKVSGWEEVPF